MMIPVGIGLGFVVGLYGLLGAALTLVAVVVGWGLFHGSGAGEILLTIVLTNVTLQVAYGATVLLLRPALERAQERARGAQNVIDEIKRGD
ncbi:MAG: hypothetical protein AAF577_14565 [Pseudomonadota bacterium]